MCPCPFRHKALRERKYFIFFSALAIATPILACIDVFRPSTEGFSTWFQRSGSAMVVFALLAEMRAYQMLEVFRTETYQGDSFYQAKTDFQNQAQIFNIAAFILIAIATLIWGYGDLLA